MSKLKKFWKYYIKGDYHCDTCPFSWEERGMEDADAGCYIKGELFDTCRLLPPVRFLIGWGRRKKAEYHRAHEYDDMQEWYEQECKKEMLFDKAIREYLDTMHYGIVHVDAEGNVIPFDGKYTALNEYYEIYRLMDACEYIFIPVKYVPLKTRWKEVLKETWNRFLMMLKPYFCK